MVFRRDSIRPAFTCSCCHLTYPLIPESKISAFAVGRHASKLVTLSDRKPKWQQIPTTWRISAMPAGHGVKFTGTTGSRVVCHALWLGHPVIACTSGAVHNFQAPRDHLPSRSSHANNQPVFFSNLAFWEPQSSGHVTVISMSARQVVSVAGEKNTRNRILCLQLLHHV